MAVETENAYAPQTVVNNLWDKLNTALEAAFELQDDFENESKFRVEFLEQAVIALSKVNARARVNEWKRVVQKFAETHKTMTIEECELELQERKSTKVIYTMAVQAEKFLAAAKSATE